MGDCRCVVAPIRDTHSDVVAPRTIQVNIQYILIGLIENKLKMRLHHYEWFQGKKNKSNSLQTSPSLKIYSVAFTI